MNYEELAIEIQRMWTVRTRVIPVIVAATESVSKAFRKYLNNLNLPGRHDIRSYRREPH